MKMRRGLLNIAYPRYKIAYLNTRYTFANVALSLFNKEVATKPTPPKLEGEGISPRYPFPSRFESGKNLKFKFLLIRFWMMSFRVTEPKAVMATRRAN